MAFHTTIHMSVPDERGNAMSVVAPDLITATEVAIVAFSQGFTSQRYNDHGATHMWVGTRWETREESMALLAKARTH